MVVDSARAGAEWSQIVVVKPGQHYRVEATITCDLDADSRATDVDGCGFVLAVEPTVDGKPAGPKRVTAGLHRASDPLVVRAYYAVPDQIRRVRVSVGLAGVTGTAVVHDVCVVPILDPDEEAHALAIPPPPHSFPARASVTTACICSAQPADRPLVEVLGCVLSPKRVETCSPESLRASKVQAGVLLLPDAKMPGSIRSVGALLKLAADRVVVVSLPAFVQLTNGALRLRRIEQDDDPIHAKVTFGNELSVGFALDDAFPYAWPGKTLGSFVQNHLRKTKSFTEFCERHGFETLVASVCDQDATSDHAVCLFKRTANGYLVVLDIEPIEAPCTTFGEVNTAAHVLLSILGLTSPGLGQYAVPARTEAGFRDSLREMAARFQPFVVQDSGLPAEDLTEQLVTIGHEDQSLGLPLTPKPVIIIRSGLIPGDMESIYGVFAWFKQLVRMAPHTCPYADALTTQFRLVWVPTVAPWQVRHGWRRDEANRVDDVEIETDSGQVAALIDVVSKPISQSRVIIPGQGGAYERMSNELPGLAAAFSPKRFVAYCTGEGERFADRDRYAWRCVRRTVQVEQDAELFSRKGHRTVIKQGGRVVRIEVPCHDAYYPSRSIESVDETATLLEHVVGLFYGLIAVNRQPSPVRFDGFPPVRTGGALIIPGRDPALHTSESQAG